MYRYVEAYANMIGSKRDYNMMRVLCWHCGKTGHFAGSCKLNDGSTFSQTIAGKVAYAKFQQATGTSKGYDPAFCKRRANEKLPSSVTKDEEVMENRPSSSTHTEYTRNMNTNKKYNPPITRCSQPVASANTSNSSSSSSQSSVSYKQKAVAVHAAEINDDNEDIDESSNTNNTAHNYDEMDNDNNDHTEFNGVIVTAYAVEATGNADEVRAIYEKKAAGSLCIPIELEGINLNYGLVDQGANRGIIRKTTYESTGLKDVVITTPVRNHYMKGSTGELVPIIGRFTSRVTTNGHYFGYSCFYIVDDTNKSDIMCDIVIGRTTLATSEYPIVDTRTGRLYTYDHSSYIQCLDGRSVPGTKGKPVIQPIDHSIDRRPNWTC